MEFTGPVFQILYFLDLICLVLIVLLNYNNKKKCSQIYKSLKIIVLDKNLFDFIRPNCVTFLDIPHYTVNSICIFHIAEIIVS